MDGAVGAGADGAGADGADAVEAAACIRFHL